MTAADSRAEGEIVRARHLVRTYRTNGQTVEAVRGVDLALDAGEIVALVGASGCGKSTLARCVCLLEGVDGGQILYRGDDTAALAVGARRRVQRRLQMVFQDPGRSLNPRWRAGRVVEEPLLVAGGFDRATRRRRAERAVAALGLDPELLERRTTELSGGQRQRLAIARALISKPRALVLDESLSSLDPSVSAQVINLLVDEVARRGLACLMVSHDLAVVRYLADRVVVMDRGLVVEEGPTTTVLDRPCHPRTRALAAATPPWPPQPRPRAEGLG